MSQVAGDSDIAAIGALVADRGRCRILLALGDGRALPASRLADEAGVSLVTLSVAWVLANRAITAPIIGASRPEQLDASLAAATYQLDPDLKQRLDDLTHDYRMGDAPR